MTAPFSVQPGTRQGVDQAQVSADGTTMIAPVFMLADRTALPAPVGPTVGTLMYADPTTGAPAFMDQYGTSNTMIDNEVEATGNGLSAWNMDPATAGATVILTTSGTVYLMRLRINWPTTLTRACIIITTAGATLTASRNWLGLYNSLGQQIAVTADQTTAFASAGFLSSAFTSPVAVLAGNYYVAILATGTTMPTLLAGAGLAPASVSVGNANLTAATGRFLIGPAAQTVLPATITLASQSLANLGTWWAGVI